MKLMIIGESGALLDLEKSLKSKQKYFHLFSLGLTHSVIVQLVYWSICFPQRVCLPILRDQLTICDFLFPLHILLIGWWVHLHVFLPSSSLSTNLLIRIVLFLMCKSVLIIGVSLALLVVGSEVCLPSLQISYAFFLMRWCFISGHIIYFVNRIIYYKIVSL